MGFPATCGIPSWCGEDLLCLGGGGHGGGLGQLGGEGAGQYYTGQRSVLVSLGLV